METIAAIATPPFPGGIGIVRLSGESACRVTERIFRSRRGVEVADLPPYTAAYGHAIAGGQVLDECIALRFRAPHSYTGEDVVELSCHGGPYVLRRLLEAAIEAGARLAQPGEFTRRAYLSGRIDLTQAEAVMDIIGARGEEAARAAVAQQEGALYRRMAGIRMQLADILADIAGYIDFPDDDIPALEPSALGARLTEIGTQLAAFIAAFDTGRLIREGIDTAIVGRTNVGKSTLMNLLAGRETSIVTDIPGTTRDIVEQSVNFAGLVLNLADTAGLRETENPVERIGVDRARRRLETASLILAVFDASAPLEEEDRALMESLAGRPAIAVLNKSDLPSRIDESYVSSKFCHFVHIAAAHGEGLPELEKAVKEAAGTEKLDPAAGMLANERQLECALRAKEGLETAAAALREGVTLDAVSVGIEQAADALAALTGERISEEVIDRVFARFCVGK